MMVSLTRLLPAQCAKAPGDKERDLVPCVGVSTCFRPPRQSSSEGTEARSIAPANAEYASHARSAAAATASPQNLHGLAVLCWVSLAALDLRSLLSSRQL